MARRALPTAGSIVTWTLSETKITPDAMRALLAAEGEDPNIVPTIDPVAAIKRATREWRPTSAGDKGRYRAEVAVDEVNRLVLNVLRRDVLSEKAEWYAIGSVEWSAKNGFGRATGIGTHATIYIQKGEQFMAAVVEQAETYCLYLDHTWIRPGYIQKRLAEMAPAKVRDRGALYIPPQFSDDLDRLARVIGKIGESSLDIFDIVPSPRSVASTSNAVRTSLAERINEMKAQIAEWKGRARRTREDAIGNVITEFKDLRDRAQLYADALSMQVDDLQAEIDEATKDARALLLGEEEEETPKARKSA